MFWQNDCSGQGARHYGCQLFLLYFPRDTLNHRCLSWKNWCIENTFSSWWMVQTFVKIETVSNMSDFYSISKQLIAQNDLYASEGLYYPPMGRWQGNYQDLPACIVQDENINIISGQIPLPLVNWSMCPWMNSMRVKISQVYSPLASSSLNWRIVIFTYLVTWIPLVTMYFCNIFIL